MEAALIPDGDTEFGDKVLEELGYDAMCTMFVRCRDGKYNIAWILENGEEYIKTFSVDEIMRMKL